MPSIRSRPSSKQFLSGNLAPCEASKSLKKHRKTDIRSGHDYYEKWNRYASQCEKEMAEEEGGLQNLSAAKEDLETINNLQKVASSQERHLQSRFGKSQTEKEWLAQREREKGNDLFKAKEYVSSVDAYSLAIDLFPKYAPAYANRAAAYIKLNRWDDVHRDCSMALEIDPKYLKALMRRSLASLQSDNPEEAIADLEAALNLDPTNQEIIQLRQKAECELLKRQVRYQEGSQPPKVKQKIHIRSTNKSNSVGFRKILIEEVEEPDIIGTSSDVSDHQVVPALMANDSSTEDICIRATPFDSFKGDIKDGVIRATKQNPCKLTSCDVNEHGSSTLLNTASTISEKENKDVLCFGTCNLNINKMLDKTGKSSDLIERIPSVMVSAANVSRPSADVTVSNSLKLEEKNFANELRLRGNEQFTTGNLEAAEASYTNSIKLNPQSAAAFANRALCRLRLSKFEGAIEDSTKALSIDHGYWKAYYHRGSALQALGRLEEALEDMKVIVLDSRPGERHVLTRKESLEKKLDEASFMPMRMGPMVITEVEDLETAPATEISSNSCSREQEKSAVQESKEQERHAEQVRFTGNAHFLNHQYTEAIACYDKSINLNPMEAAAFANRALCYMKLGDLNQAKKDCIEALRLDPAYKKVYLRRSIINEKLGDLQSALNDLQELQAFLPADAKVKAKMEELKKHLGSNRTLKCGEANSRDGPKNNSEASDNMIKLPIALNTSNGLGTCLETNNAPSYPHDSLLSEEPKSSKKEPSTTKTSTGSVLPARPKTALEFERGCLSTQKEPKILRQYIKSVELSKYSIIFKDSLSAVIMKNISEALWNSFMPDDAPGALAILQALVKVKRFKLVVMLLPTEVKQTLALVMEWISTSNIAPVKVLCKLKSDYRL
ncbi:hypothetical protein O6H91_05G053600 [Diphasiastrum complanatum]|uniref:Uncharacterized protein n=1 Tax=Diphasiastrum complanatum TaxID=34168 RepID=A0ACC2DNM1_DIPCM|nr:hypothetical protein O6H91_05G053600 [Diphasiastrum complanatum]